MTVQVHKALRGDGGPTLARASIVTPASSPRLVPLDLAEKLYLLEAYKLLLLQAFNRLSQELTRSDCRRALDAVELVLKYLVRPLLPKEPGSTCSRRTSCFCSRRKVRHLRQAARVRARAREARSAPEALRRVPMRRVPDGQGHAQEGRGAVQGPTGPGAA